MSLTNENTIEVSVCIISYNHESYISECLESIISQITDFRFEILVRDDCSTDKTVRIIEEYRQKYPSIIKVLPSFSNLGMNKNLRTVFNAASGKYIAVCEGDDFWCDKNKLQIQYGLAMKHRNLNFFIHACDCVNSASVKVSLAKNNFYSPKGITTFSIEDVLSFSGQFAPTSSYFIKATELKSLPDWFDDAPIGDFFIELYALLRGNGLYISKILSSYRVQSLDSWSDKMRTATPSMKIKYAQSMKEAIAKCKIDFSENNKLFDKKVNALSFIEALAQFKLHNIVAFRKLIVPVDGKFVSRYHKLLCYFRWSNHFSTAIVNSYDFIKVCQRKLDFE